MNTMKKTVALLLCAAMTVPAFACSLQTIDPAEGSSTVSEGDDNSVAENSGDNSENDGNSSGGDASADYDDNAVTDEWGQKNQPLSFDQPINEEPVVSSRRAEDGTVYVDKTDINGAVVTDANGEKQTEIYTGETNAASYEPDYVPSIKTYQAYWLDISKRKDFVFDGNLLEFEIEVAQDAPNGIYPVEIYFTDFSNYNGNSDENGEIVKNVVSRVGYLCINSEEPEIPALGTAMTLTPETVSAKPGETVRMNVRIDNNPGIVAFVLRMHYDDKIMTILEAGAGDELGARATLTTNTLDE